MTNSKGMYRFIGGDLHMKELWLNPGNSSYHMGNYTYYQVKRGPMYFFFESGLFYSMTGPDWKRFNLVTNKILAQIGLEALSGSYD